LVIFVGMCTNDTEPIDDSSIFDPNYFEPNWGLRQTDDPSCYSNETIKNWLLHYKPKFHMFVDEEFINFDSHPNELEESFFRKFENDLSLDMEYNNYFYS